MFQVCIFNHVLIYDFMFSLQACFKMNHPIDIHIHRKSQGFGSTKTGTKDWRDWVLWKSVRHALKCTYRISRIELSSNQACPLHSPFRHLHLKKRPRVFNATCCKIHMHCIDRLLASWLGACSTASVCQFLELDPFSIALKAHIEGQQFSETHRSV